MSDTSEAAQAYRVFFNYGKNFMTPDVIEYGWVSDNVAYELSKGSGIIAGTTLFGVTFLDKRNSQPKHLEYSSAVENEVAGRALIETVRKEIQHATSI